MIYELMSRETKKDIDKIRVSSAEIVVHGTKEKPYYEIKYFDLSDHKIHIGYSSYKLDVVFGYLEKYFEIVDSKKSNQIEDFCNRDLISRKTVLNYLKEQNANLLMEKQKNGFVVSTEACRGMESAVNAFRSFILDLPTFFNKERVIIKLKELEDDLEDCDNISGDEAIEYAIEIVEKGGVK